MRHSKSLLAIPVALIVAGVLHACGGTDSGSGMPTTATVTGYVTDDLGGYENVVLTLNSVQLRHTSGRTCEIIKGPLEIDAAELGHDELLEQVDTTTCEAGPYNRLYVELDENVSLVGPPPGNAASECKFVSYFDAIPGAPNQLACANNGICSLNITGAVNLIAGNHEHIALDVDLKNFLVDPNVTPCAVTLKVSPLHAEGKLMAGFRKRISGTVANLDPGADTFTLTVKGKPFTVRYAGVTDQDNLDLLLERAALDGLRTSVRCDTIDLTTSPPTCTTQTDANPDHALKAITVKAEGTISALNIGATTFTLGYGVGGGTLLPVNYAEAANRSKVFGIPANGAFAEVKLFGSDLTSFLAREVEVQ